MIQPEYTAYPNGSHMRVSCVDCHVGTGLEYRDISRSSPILLTSLWRGSEVYYTSFQDVVIHKLLHIVLSAMGRSWKCRYLMERTGDALNWGMNGKRKYKIDQGAIEDIK